MPNKNNFDDASLLALLAEGSEYAFQLIFDRYRDHIYQVAFMYLKSAALAEEVVQDIFLKIWFQRKDLFQVNAIEPWLYTVAKNVSLNCLKKVARERIACENWGKHNKEVENSTDFKIRNAQYKALIEEGINNLSFRQQQVYRLAKEEGQSYEQIGIILSMSPLTVKTHMARALDAIRNFLKKHGELLTFLWILEI